MECQPTDPVTAWIIFIIFVGVPVACLVLWTISNAMAGDTARPPHRPPPPKRLGDQPKQMLDCDACEESRIDLSKE